MLRHHALTWLALVAAGACSRTPVPAPRTATAFFEPARPAAPVAQKPPPPAAASPELREASLFFDYDAYTLRGDAGLVLQKIADGAKTSAAAVRIEGNCDERGTPEYNMALGEHRARAAERYLEALGVPKARINVVSYGALHPAAQGHDEGAWSRNRRDDIVVQ
jgi:peptidoglycan-associated lipoprotein